MNDVEVIAALRAEVQPLAKKLMDHEGEIKANKANIETIQIDIESIWTKLGKMSGKMLLVVLGTPTAVGAVVGILLYLSSRGS